MSQRPLRVLHVEAGRHLFGGAQQVLYLLEGLPAHGVESLLACPAGSEVAAAAQARGLAVAPLAMGGEVDLPLLFRLQRLIRAHRADLVHLHSRRGADTFGALAARLAGAPAVLSRRVDARPPRALLALHRATCAHLVAISAGIARVVAQAGWPTQRLSVVPSAVRAERFAESVGRDALRARFALPADAVVVGVAAQFIERKGHAVLLEALAGLGEAAAQVHVLCFGRGALEPALRERCRVLRLAERVHFPGFVDDLAELLGALDLLVHPALMEGLGVVLLEAAAAGTPIVASRAGGIPEIVIDGETGLLVPPGEPAALQAALRTALEDPARMHAMAARARERVLARHTVEAMVAGNVAVYRQVVDAG